MSEMTWRNLVTCEPELGQLLNEVRRIKDDKRKPGFCANACWYGWGEAEPSLKDRKVSLVGWRARHEVLRTSAAYDLAYKTLYGALPDCRNCACVAFALFA